MTIYPRGNFWYFEATVGNRRVKKSTGVSIKKSKKTAMARALEILEELKSQPKGITLKEAFDKTYELKWRHNKDSETPVGRGRVIMEILGKNTLLESLTKDHVLNLQQELFNRGITEATVNRYMATLSVVYTTLEVPRLFRIPKFREPEGRIRYLSEEEERQLLALVEQPYADFFACLLDTGMRFSELNNLMTRDVLFDLREIHLWENKGDLPRTIPMTTRVHQKLSERQKVATDGQLWGLNYDACHWQFFKAKRAMKLEHDKDFTIHALRHTCASRLVQRGVDLYVVQRILGHSSIQVTEKYAHLNTKTLRGAIGVLEKKG